MHPPLRPEPQGFQPYPVHPPPTTSSPPYAFIVEGSSRPQILAIVDAIKKDVKQWSLSYSGKAEPLPATFPQRLRTPTVPTDTDVDDAEQWTKLLR